MRRLAALLTAVVFAAPFTATAAEWPSRPIRVIAPAPAGGAADTFARMLSDHLPDMVGGRGFVENRPGAGGLIGAAAAAHAEPDGHTLYTSSIAYNAIAPAVSANPGFDPLKDFTHIAYFGGPPIVFIVRPEFGVRSIKDLVERARKGEAINYVSPGVGTLGHLVGEMFAQSANIKLQHVPTKGASQAMVDLISGNVPLATMTWTSALGQVRAGKVIPLALTSNKRVAEAPDLPTLRDLGFDDLVATTWFGLSGPAGIPADITQKLNRAVVKILDLPAVRARLDRDAVETRAMTAPEFTAFMASEIGKWGPVAKRVMKTN